MIKFEILCREDLKSKLAQMEKDTQEQQQQQSKPSLSESEM